MIFPCAGWVLFLGCGVQILPALPFRVVVGPRSSGTVSQTVECDANTRLCQPRVFSSLPTTSFIPKPSDMWVALWGGYPHPSIFSHLLFSSILSLPSFLSLWHSHRATWPSEALLCDPLPHPERALLSLMFSCLTNYFNLSFLCLTPF